MAETLNFPTIFSLSASVAPKANIREVTTSAQRPNALNRKSKIPPISPLTTRTIACPPPFSPATRISVVAVASGNGNLPCISFTKYFRNGMRKRMPRKPPSIEARNTW